VLTAADGVSLFRVDIRNVSGGFQEGTGNRRKQMRFQKAFLLGLVCVAALFLVGCAAGPNVLAHSAGAHGGIAGFWLGLWHGFICQVTFIVSLFSDKVHLYEVHNNGGWYNFGFLLGACMIFGGGGSSARQRKSCTQS
jgi:hypothetical protein